MLDILDLIVGLHDLRSPELGIRFVRAIRRWFRKRLSGSWPAAPSTVLSGNVAQAPGGGYTLSATYTFRAGGDRYGGRYECEFTAEATAQEALQRLLGSPPRVRYRPGDPDTSVLDVQ
jgi:hypothetical protein